MISLVWGEAHEKMDGIISDFNRFIGMGIYWCV